MPFWKYFLIGTPIILVLTIAFVLGTYYLNWDSPFWVNLLVGALIGGAVGKTVLKIYKR